MVQACTPSLAINPSQVKAHYCPNHKKYEPKRGCADHVECSDPVFHCFELSKVATREGRKKQGRIARQESSLV